MRHEWNVEGGKIKVRDSAEIGGATEYRIEGIVRGGIVDLLIPEILRLAARIQTLEAELSAIADAVEDKGLPDCDADLTLPEKVRRVILYTEAGNEYSIPALEARIVTLEADAATLKATNAMLGKENRELNDRMRSQGDNFTALVHQSNAQESRIHELERQLQATLDSLALANETARALKNQQHARLAKLDALLASEKIPDGLWKTFGERPAGTEGWHDAYFAWRWFRETFRGPIARHAARVVELKDDARFVAKDPAEQPKADLLGKMVEDLKSQPPPPVAVEGAQAVMGTERSPIQPTGSVFVAWCPGCRMYGCPPPGAPECGNCGGRNLRFYQEVDDGGADPETRHVGALRREIHGLNRRLADKIERLAARAAEVAELKQEKAAAHREAAALREINAELLARQRELLAKRHDGLPE